MKSTRTTTAVLLVVVTVACASACGASSNGGSGGGGNRIGGTVRVFAAASLTESFTTLGKQFESAHPGTNVVFDFGPSSGLATQIAEGAPADVFASASTKNMDAVVAAGKADSPTPFARNVMELAVPPTNPAHIHSVADLARPRVKLALCQPQVPCGATAAAVLARAHVVVRPVTEELDVKAVLSKVELGEVDAGIVYVTDVRAAGTRVRAVAIADADNASTTYPIATLTRSGNAATARAFVAYVLSAAGRRVLADDGFRSAG